MSVLIENEYKDEIGIEYEKIIKSVIEESVAFVQCPYECEVYVTITDNENIQVLNREHRNLDKPTDVLSFPMIVYQTPGDLSEVDKDLSNFNPDSGELILGDIVISYDKVMEQSREYNHSKEREIAFLTAHSMLHLFGYDHIDAQERIEMEKMQNNILENLGITRE